VILLLKEGTLDDEFQRDPLGTSICLLYTLVGFLAQLDDHNHGPDVVVSSGPPDPELLAFAEALKVPVPKTGNSQGGLGAILLQLIVAELAKVLKELLDKWADS